MHFLQRKNTQDSGGIAVQPTEKKGKPKKLKKKTILILVVAALTVGCGGFGLYRLFFTGSDAVVLTGTTTYGTLDTTIEGTGTTIPADSVTYTTASTSEILQVCVAAGDTVQEGDLLYVQDDSEVDDAIEEYQDEIADYQDELTDYNDQIADIYEEMAELTVRAEDAGHLSGVSVTAGDTVRVGDQLAVLSVDGTMTLTQYFSYIYEDQIKTGMSAVISVPDLMASYTGTVTKISKVERITTEGTRCFAVTVSIDNPGALTEGMTAGGYLTGSSGSIYPAIEGSLQYADTITITAQAAGEVTAVNAEDYQSVAAGDLLFVINGADYEKQLQTLNTQISRLNDKITTLQEKIEEAEESRADYEVHSEITGKVIAVSVREGEKPQQGRTAVMVYNLDSMSVTVNIDELDIEYVTKGMDVTIVRSGAETNETYTGTVSEVSLEATSSGGVATFPITIEIDSDGALSAGVSVSYYISTGDSNALEEGVLAPIAAVQYTDEGSVLFVQADQRPDNAIDLEGVEVPKGFYAVPVETGSSNANYIRILSGVEEDATVFLGYMQSAPSNGDTTSSGDETESGGNGMPGDMSGGMPDFSGGNSGMSGMSGGPGGGPMG